jgi:hypothetical protein
VVDADVHAGKIHSLRETERRLRTRRALIEQYTARTAIPHQGHWRTETSARRPAKFAGRAGVRSTRSALERLGLQGDAMMA